MAGSAHKPSLYEQVVDVTSDYLGPAAERFISRQIESHLDKNPHELDRNDMEKLLDWIRLTISLLTEDEAMIERYTTSLRELKEN